MVTTHETNSIPAKLAWLMNCYRCGHRNVEAVARQISEPHLRCLAQQQAQMFESFIDQLAPWTNQSQELPLHHVHVLAGRHSGDDDHVLLRLHLWTLEGLERAIQHAADPREVEELAMLLGYHYDRVCWWRGRMTREMDHLGIALEGPVLARLRYGDHQWGEGSTESIVIGDHNERRLRQVNQTHFRKEKPGASKDAGG